jgi:hypothetical protein
VSVSVAASELTAVDDTASTTGTTPVTIAVLANDSDTGGAAPLLAGVDSPMMGTVVANLDGTVTYTPSAGASGPDSFTYQITDGYGNYATATVTVDVSGGDSSGGGFVANPDTAATR